MGTSYKISLSSFLSITIMMVLGALLFSANQAVADDDDYVVQLGYYNCDHMTAAPIAKEAGIFDELGLKVNVTGNGQVPQAMAAGRMDAGYIGIHGLMRARLKGAPIFVSANNHLGGSYYLVVSNDIKTPQDLIGKKLSLGSNPTKRSASWVGFTAANNIPVDPAKYEVFAMADKDEFIALKTHSLDGYLTCDPWGSMAEYDGCGWIMETFSKLPSTNDWGVCCVLAMSNEFGKEHPELAKKMIQAHVKALEFIYTQPKRAAEIFAKAYSVPEEVALMTIFKKTVAEERTLNWEVDKGKIQDEIDYNVSIGTLDAAPPLEEFVNVEFLNAAKVDDFKTFIKEKVDPIFPMGMTYEQWKAKALEIHAQRG
ncbi:ABC transporter substrate-binding subunit SaoX [Maridesulfovibrio frigidus]|uniref:ABC transporter substrate-binding subunit SaoX n=1 Tax=Maridesulfovibrio frigidus TaxID=340956 RepID=UPI0004E0FE9A|nr:ABC transporter substrate-binding subunit SaoX [Maridesulfovibrio frigidus]